MLGSHALTVCPQALEVHDKLNCMTEPIFEAEVRHDLECS